MNNLALAIRPQRVLRKQGQPVFLHARPLGAELEGAPVAQLHHGPPQRVVAIPGAVLVQLPLGSDAHHPGPRARAVGQALRAQGAGWRGVVDGEVGGRRERVTESPETPPRYLQVAVEGGRCAPGPEAEEVFVVVVDEHEERGQEDEPFGEGRSQAVD